MVWYVGDDACFCSVVRGIFHDFVSQRPQTTLTVSLSPALIPDGMAMLRMRTRSSTRVAVFPSHHPVDTNLEGGEIRWTIVQTSWTIVHLIL